MSYDPMNGPAQRPRSTPIPDPDRPGQALPPPTAAQFLNEASSVPWAQQPGPDVNASFAASTASTFVPPSGRSPFGRVLALTIGLVVIIAAAAVVVGVLVTKKATESITIPTFGPAVTAEHQTSPVTVPAIPTVAPPATVGTATPVTADPVPTTVAEATTLPTPPPTVPVTLYPGGAASLFQGGAPRSVVDQLDESLPGEPSQFTQIVLFADYAVVTTQDPANPTQLLGAYWRTDGIGNGSVTSTGGGGFASLLFTGGDVNWEAVQSLVETAPALLGLGDGQVTYVTVGRSGFGNPPPVRLDIYVEGLTGKGYIEAAADGTVVSVNPG